MAGGQFKTTKYRQVLAARIRRAREEAGLTQEQIAQGGLDLRNYQKIEAGDRTPTMQVLYRFANIVGKTVSWLTEAPSDLYLTEDERIAHLSSRQRKRRHRKTPA